MALNVTPFIGTDNFNMETFNNMISQINSGVNSEISDVLAQLGTKAKIQTGSYVGTGTHGASNPCSLTFDFVPKFVFVTRGLYSGLFDNSNGVVLKVGATALVGKSLTISIDGFTIKWYNGESADYQLNRNGDTYSYVAIG